MNFFDEPLRRLSAFTEVDNRLNRGEGPLQLTGCSESQKVHIMNQAGSSKTRLIVTYDELQARALLEDYRFFSPNVYLFPAKDLLFYQADMKSKTIGRERMTVLRHLYERKEDEQLTIITTIQGVMNVLAPMDEFRGMCLDLSEGSMAEMEALSIRLISLGYERTARVENPGEFAIHGGILDVYDLTEELPYRIEFFDTEIDTIRTFSPESQRTLDRLEEITIYPATELFLNGQMLSDGLVKIKKEYEKAKDRFLKKEALSEAASLQEMIRDIEDAGKRKDLNGILERFLPYFYAGCETIVDYLPEDAVIFMEEPQRMEEYAGAVEMEFAESFTQRLERGLALPGQAGITRSVKQCFAALETGRTLALTGLDTKLSMIRVKDTFHLEVQPMVSYQNNFQGLVAEMKRMEHLKYTLVLLVPSHTRGVRMAEELREYQIHAYYSDDRERELQPGTLLVTYGNLRKGFVYPQLKFAVVTESDIYGTEKKKRRRKKTDENGQRIRSFSELSVGDYVVHENYGIGVYKGIVNLTADEVARDYLEISYGKSGTLYIPVTNLDVVQKYASSDAKPPKISRLDSPEWKKTKARVKAAVEEVAEELVTLYAARQNGKGYQYGPDTVWQKEFEEMFPYEETQDQLDAIDDTKKDMESEKIMDRLVCGDVGFGKTEVAIRAAFKAVQENKQVAYLVPTTILAQQHYNTFSQRMSEFAVTTGLLSRFRTAGQQKETIEGLKRGSVDIVIGTHRILSKDVQFKNLGLLIIDEEQRFGVAHKEKIKQMKNNVDVLTLTATPIPRTLHMSMIGVRDLSVLEEPPTDRQAIQTYVMEYSEELVREAITRELARGGQVYYVYNRVSDIREVADKVQQLVPDANVAFAHGKMSERELESRMLAFIEGEIDVLVSTTIIETGLDIPNVNTIIVHDAERYGLSQLYQLRGRVGRSNRQAYAFIMYRKNRVLNEDAEKRLEAIRQFTELGSGIKIAMQDLEIRGAGSVLGNAQSGHMMLVGYELYCKMLSEAVKKQRGIEDEERDFDTVLDIRADAFIPSSYIATESLKLELYKKISFLETEEEKNDLEDELLDRFGEAPRQVKNLMEVALLRAMARSMYISEIKGNVMDLTFRFAPFAKLNNAGIPQLIEKFRGAMSFLPGENPGIRWHQLNIREGGKKQILPLLRELMTEMKSFLII